MVLDNVQSWGPVDTGLKCKQYVWDAWWAYCNIVECDVKPQVNQASYYLCSMLFMGIIRVVQSV